MLAALAPLLLPAPRHLELLGSTIACPSPLRVSGADGETLDLALSGLRWVHAPGAHDTWLVCQIDPALGGHEHYVLTVLARGGVQPIAQLNASDAHGLRHGLRTLAQLIRQYGASLPTLRIDDQPAFATRGVMLDISRDRVPTMAEALRIADWLAALKYNHLELYTEHTFAYHGHEDVWRHASPFDAREIRDLDRACAARGIQLVANQNCFGHLERWLKHPRYRPLAEAERWEAFGQIREYPFSLCPGDRGALPLVRDLLGQLLPNFRTRMVNIGCDETFDLGQGRSKEAVATRGRAAVYLDFVREVCAIARTQGCQPLLWADIALEHPEHLGQLPEDVIALAWGYEDHSPFARWCSQITKAGREAWVCPGTSSWCSFTGRTSERRGNLFNAARDGLAGGATGYLVTDWGDHGHRQQWPISAVALAEGAHRAWSGTAAYDPRAASLHAFHDRSLTLAPWLDALGEADRPLRLLAGKDTPEGRQSLGNRSALFADTQCRLDEPWQGDFGDWTRVTDHLRTLSPPSSLLTGIDHLLDRECRHAWKVAEFCAARGACRRSRETVSAYPALAASLRGLMADYRELWLHRSRHGGIEDSLAHWQRLLDDLEAPR